MTRGLSMVTLLAPCMAMGSFGRPWATGLHGRTGLPVASIALASDLEETLCRVFAAEASLDGAPTLSQFVHNLEAAGFDLIGHRDLKIAEALQTTYLERLPIRPPRLAKFDKALSTDLGVHRATVDRGEPLLYDGRLMLWRRAYGAEGRTGRFILPKLDYLLGSSMLAIGQRAVAGTARLAEESMRVARATLARLAASLELEIPLVLDDVVAADNDEVSPAEALLDASAIERFSIADAFAGLSPLDFVTTIFNVTSLSEPTFEEVVVAWRGAPPRPRSSRQSRLPSVRRVVVPSLQEGEPTDAAEEASKQASGGAELRLLTGIPIAIFEATLPDNCLGVRREDWLKLDLVSTPALLSVLFNLRFDDARLEAAAAVSVAVWLVRTALQYRAT